MHQHELGDSAEQRLASDLRTFSVAGIERVGWSWRQKQGQAEVFQAAERAALHAIEQTDRGPAWEELRRSLRGLMEGSNGLLSWKEEHGHESHTAERDVYGAALALLVVACRMISMSRSSDGWRRRSRGCSPRDDTGCTSPLGEAPRVIVRGSAVARLSASVLFSLHELFVARHRRLWDTL